MIESINVHDWLFSLHHKHLNHTTSKWRILKNLQLLILMIEIRILSLLGNYPDSQMVFMLEKWSRTNFPKKMILWLHFSPSCLLHLVLGSITILSIALITVSCKINKLRTIILIKKNQFLKMIQIKGFFYLKMQLPGLPYDTIRLTNYNSLVSWWWWVFNIVKNCNKKPTCDENEA